VIALLVAVGTGAWALKRDADIRWATDTALPEIGRLAEQDQFVAAFTLAGQAEPYLRDTRRWRSCGRSFRGLLT
jgi:hypothetical protein